MPTQAMEGEVIPFPGAPAPNTPAQLRLPAGPAPTAPSPPLPKPQSRPLKHWPESEKPRERLLRLGAGSLSDAELLAILLRTGEGSGGGGVMDQARGLLQHFGSLEALSRADAAELCTLKGIGPAKACSIAAAFAFAGRATGSGTGKTAIACSKDIFTLMSGRLTPLRAEEFWVLLLNTKNVLLREVLVAKGSLAGAQVHPREVFGAAVREGAAAVIFVHNHPSGDPTPSASDRDLTRRLQESAQLLGIRILDHVVIGAGRWESFADRGWL